MSFGDLYIVPRGADVAPGLPPVDLPQAGGPVARPRIEITPGPDRRKPQPVPPPDGAWAAQLPDFKPAAAVDKSPEATDGAWAAALPDHSPEVEKAAKAEAQPGPEVSGSRSAALGAAHGITFGAAPAIAGAEAASGLPEGFKDIPFIGGVAPIVGAARLAKEKLIDPMLGIDSGGLEGQITGDRRGPATRAYEERRDRASREEKAAQEQHPYLFGAGQVAGSLATPGFGIGTAGTLAARAGRGIVAGGIGGGLEGTGSAVSEGASPGEVAKRGAVGAAIGAPLGGTVNAAIGRRAASALSPGQQAAATAERIGAPLPRGTTSDSRFVQNTTARLRQFPFAGERIGERVSATQAAAGREVESVAGRMAGPATDRASADVMARAGLQGVVDRNKAAQDAGYNALRGQIDQGQHFTMPATDAALDAVMAARKAAGWANPALGLEQFRTVAGGATFNGAHRARTDARAAGGGGAPNPGYDKADFNRITRAMTADLRGMVQAAATRGPQRALRAFDAAETEFGRLAEQNKILQRLVDAKGEASIATLLNASKEKGGNLKLLAQLRNSMPAQDFEVVGGTLLSELGHNNASGQFSLSQFVTNWDKVSDRAKSILFPPDHLRNIQEIVHMGSHVKKALSESSTSHSANLLVMLDLVKDAALLGHDIAAGGPGLASAIGAGTTLGLWGLTRWLASPAKAASMSAWSRALQGLGANPTPARLAVFNAATRNLANNLGVPVENILRATAARMSGRADEPVQQQK